MDNKGLLIIIAVILLGIFTVALIDSTEQSSSTEIAETMGNTVENAGKQIEQNNG